MQLHAGYTVRMTLLPGKRRVQTGALLALAGALLVLGLVSSLFTYTSIDGAGRQHIVNRAYTVREMLPKEQLAALTGSEQDLSSPEYLELKETLTRVRGVNSDVRFVYLVGRTPADEVFFYVDSEDPASPDYSPPGQVYEEAPWQMHAVFDDGQGRSDGPTQDRWGVWISAYAPVYGASGEIVALLGMDLPAQAFIIDALTYATLPLLAALLVVALILFVHTLRRKEEYALAQKAEFLSIASHEIRTPLTGVRWALEDLLSSDPAVVGETKTTLTQVHDVATRLIERVNNLLDVTKLEQQGRVQKEVVVMRPFLEQVIQSFVLSAKQKNVQILLDASLPADLSLQIDQDVMRHVFFNLVSNAVKYTKEGTEVHVGYEKGVHTHVFSVSDQGSGIPVEEQERVFEGYHRTGTRSQIEGTGLGLYLVRKAVTLAGGKVAIDQSVTKGTRFLVTLPG